MGRLFSVLALAAALMFVPARGRIDTAQPVFFSMLFPQLVPQHWLEKLPQEKGAAFL